MVEREKVMQIIKFYLPQVEEDVANRISEDVMRDVELITHSLIRRTVAQEREQIYWNGFKNQDVRYATRSGIS